MTIACQPKEEQVMTDEEAKTLLDQFMETVMNVDTTLAKNILHPNCVLSYPVLPEPIKGIEEYKKFLKNTANTFSEFIATIEEVNVKGNEIWCRYSMRGIHTGPMGEIPATGKSFQVTGMAITKVKDGKIIEDNTYWNVWGLYNQLGFTLVPPTLENEI
jgi:steroid delta-isomerase-like uncharacterized protein